MYHTDNGAILIYIPTLRIIFLQELNYDCSVTEVPNLGPGDRGAAYLDVLSAIYRPKVSLRNRNHYISIYIYIYVNYI